MFLKILLIFLLKAAVTCANVSNKQGTETKNEIPNAIEITDEQWDKIQKGQWLLGFFDGETKESRDLENDFLSFAELLHLNTDMKVGIVFSPQSPGLSVRFLVTDFPKAFYIKNGVAHEIPKVNKDVIKKLIMEKKWKTLKPVNFLSNPFSVQMSLLSHLFIHAVNLYNFENAIVQQFISAPSATDIVFALTFIIVGTLLGLLMTCAFGLIGIFFMDSKESKEDNDDKKHNDNEEENEEKEKEKETDESSNVRKRK